MIIISSSTKLPHEVNTRLVSSANGEASNSQTFSNSGSDREISRSLKPLILEEPLNDLQSAVTENKTVRSGKTLMRKAYLFFLTSLHWFSLRKNMKSQEESGKLSMATKAQIRTSNGEGHLEQEYPQVLQPLIQSLRQAKKGNEVYRLLNLATQEIPDFRKKANVNTYTYQGYSFYASTHLNQRDHQAVLKLAKVHNLKSAPQLIDSLKIDDHYCVVITKAPGLEDDKTPLPFKTVEENMEGQDLKVSEKFNQAKRNFYEEMRLLAQDGYIHPMMQSKELTNYLLVHPEDGHIVLGGWDLMMPLLEESEPDTALQQLQDELSLDTNVL